MLSHAETAETLHECAHIQYIEHRRKQATACVREALNGYLRNVGHVPKGVQVKKKNNLRTVRVCVCVFTWTHVNTVYVQTAGACPLPLYMTTGLCRISLFK